MELSQAHLRYLLAIGELSQGKAAVSSTQVARVLQVSRPSVTRMLAVLAEKDLVTKERYGSLKAIFAYFTELVRESEGMGTAYVSTAVELTKEQKQAVREKLLQTTSYQSFDVYYHVDPTLIGGMVIRVGDRVVDSSIRTKLEDMKKQLLNIQLG